MTSGALTKFIPPHVRKWLTFAAFGIPGIALAIPLNFFLVQYVRLPIAVAYGLVVVFQIALGFQLCRVFVFEKNEHANVWRQFSLFFSGLSLFRFADWLVYIVLVYHFGINFILAQIFTIFFFSILKFLYSERIFRPSLDA